MVDWIMYGKIQEQKRNGLNKSQVARNLQINRETVRTYWDMTPAEFSASRFVCPEISIIN